VTKCAHHRAQSAGLVLFLHANESLAHPEQSRDAEVHQVMQED